MLRWIAATLVALALAGCAGFGQEPLNVNVVGMDPLEGEGMEARFALKLRVQNPTDNAIDYDGISLALEVNGARFATGVSDQKGVVPRLGERVVTVPVSVPAAAMIRQIVGFIDGDRTKVTYRLRGRLHGGTFAGASFSSTGEIDLPTALGEGAK